MQVFIELTGWTTGAKIDVTYGAIEYLSPYTVGGRTGTVVGTVSGREFTVKEPQCQIKTMIDAARIG